MPSPSARPFSSLIARSTHPSPTVHEHLPAVVQATAVHILFYTLSARSALDTGSSAPSRRRCPRDVAPDGAPDGAPDVTVHAASARSCGLGGDLMG